MNRDNAEVIDPDTTDGIEEKRSARWFRSGRLIALLVALIIVGYIAGMVFAHQINDGLDFAPSADQDIPGGSKAVAMTIGLIDREVNETTWAPNKPFPFPSSLLDNMPSFQLGLMYAISRFAIDLTDSLGRTRGSSQVDADLDKASGLLKYDGTIWVWEPSISLMPTARAESQYNAATRALENYNRRLGSGQATLDRRADNLINFLDRIAADLGSTSALLADQSEDSGLGWFDSKADDIFYNTKGRLYGYYKILQGCLQSLEAGVSP
jgi:hypothetical protein